MTCAVKPFAVLENHCSVVTWNIEKDFQTSLETSTELIHGSSVNERPLTAMSMGLNMAMDGGFPVSAGDCEMTRGLTARERAAPQDT